MQRPEGRRKGREGGGVSDEEQHMRGKEGGREGGVPTRGRVVLGYCIFEGGFEGEGLHVLHQSLAIGSVFANDDSTIEVLHGPRDNFSGGSCVAVDENSQRYAGGVSDWR